MRIESPILERFSLKTNERFPFSIKKASVKLHKFLHKLFLNSHLDFTALPRAWSVVIRKASKFKNTRANQSMMQNQVATGGNESNVLE